MWDTAEPFTACKRTSRRSESNGRRKGRKGRMKAGSVWNRCHWHGAREQKSRDTRQGTAFAERSSLDVDMRSTVVRLGEAVCGCEEGDG
eukprot:838112-Rhodomonas_salina.1